MIVASSIFADITPLRESPEFRLFYFGEAASSLGRQLTLVAAPIQVYSLTNSSLLVGLLGLAQFPALLIGSTIGGMWSDAWDRRNVLIFAQTVLAMISVGLALNASGTQSVSIVFGLTTLQAFFFSIDAPARTSAVPRLVKTAHIPSAYALQVLKWQLMKAIGPILAGVVIVWWSLAIAYWIDVITFSIAIASLIAMKPMPALDGGTRPGLRSILDGFKYLKSRKAIQGAFLIDISATVFGVPRALFPEMGLSVFGGTEATVGLLFAAPGIGALIAAATSGWVNRVSRAGVATTISVAIWGAGITAFGFSHNISFALVFLAIAGGADAISSVFRATIVQLSTPDHLRGRLSGIKIAAVAGGPRLGDAEAGIVSRQFGPSVASWTGGIASIAGAFVVAKAFPAFYNWVIPADDEDLAAEAVEPPAGDLNR
ncbi:MAG: MFS family permease [Verrucomicrobiales bacterium]|jgi:MFS family permease